MKVSKLSNWKNQLEVLHEQSPSDALKKYRAGRKHKLVATKRSRRANRQNSS